MLLNTQDFCPSPGPLMSKKNQESRTITLFRPPCKRWNCPYCQQQNALQWAFVAWHGTQQLQNDGHDMVFVTVTSHEKLSVEQAFAVWPDAWKKLRQRIVREYGKPEYYMVSERHQTGKLHMHAMVSRAINQNWLKSAARGCGLGYIAHVRPVDQAIGAAFYATKYLTKFGAQWPTRWRRVRLSQGWPRVPEPDDDDQHEYKVLMTRDITEDFVSNYAASMGVIGWFVEVGESVSRHLTP